MPVIQSSIIIKRGAADLFELLKRMEAFPRFIAGVEQVKVRHLSKRLIVSEWSINIDGTRVRWTERDTFDEASLTVKFSMTEGDFASYSGEWRVLENGVCSRLSFVLSIDWELQWLRDELVPELERKARLAVRWMLREFRRRVGAQAVLQQTTSSSEASALTTETTIVSEPISYTNRRGQKIIGFFDHLKHASGDEPIIVMPPGYGETKRDVLPTAYYLARNGFRVIRYDAAEHLGESEGDIATTTMPKLKTDLLDTIEYVQRTFGVARVGVVASSLAQRMAIKAAAEDARVAFLLGVVGVVNLQATLKSIYQEDIIHDVAQGRVKTSYDVLGFDIDQAYPVTAIQERYHDLQTTVEDMRTIRAPVVFLVAEQDAWVRLEDVQLVVESHPSRHGELYVIPEAMHQIFENRKAARTALRQVVASAAKYLCGRELPLPEVIEPNFRELARQNQLEKQRLGAKKTITTDEERGFWKEYLGSYEMLGKVPDYRQYLALMLERLGDIQDGDVVLDAGCGVGYFGAWMIASLINRHASGQGPTPAWRYIGVDFVATALEQAKTRHAEMLAAQSNGLASSTELRYFLSDLNSRIPLADQSVNKICSSLVLSYLRDPMFAVRELLRVLKPGGTIVITSLKPYPDLSQIYRNFVTQAQSEQDIIEARRLLSSAGRIRQKESEGFYSFFSEKELMALMVALGAEKVATSRSFGNQANVVVASKPLRGCALPSPSTVLWSVQCSTGAREQPTSCEADSPPRALSGCVLQQRSEDLVRGLVDTDKLTLPTAPQGLSRIDQLRWSADV